MPRIRYIIIILAALSMNAAQAEVKFDGEARIRAKGAWNYFTLKSLDQRQINYTHTRVRVGMWWNVFEDMDVMLQPQFAKVWGWPGGTSGDLADGSAFTGTNVFNNRDKFGVHQGYLTFRPLSSDVLSLTFGRMELQYGDGVVLTSFDYKEEGRAYDGVKASVKTGLGVHDFMLMTLDEQTYAEADGGSSSFGKGDNILYGLYNSMTFGDYLKAVDVYGLFNTITGTVNTNNPGTATTTNTNRLQAGARVAGKASMLDYSGEYVFETTRNVAAATSVSGFFTHLKAGYTIMPEMFTRVFAKYSLGSKNYTATGMHTYDFAGTNDVFSPSNLQYIEFGVESGVMPKVGALLQMGLYSIVDPAIGFKHLAVGTLGAGATTDKAAGMDIVAGFSWYIHKNAKFSGGVNYFMPGKWFESAKAATAGAISDSAVTTYSATITAKL